MKKNTPSKVAAKQNEEHSDLVELSQATLAQVGGAAAAIDYGVLNGVVTSQPIARFISGRSLWRL